MAAAEKTL